ncbi:MAG: DUF4234 domain-containing protein [Clostridiales bacterium]|nr:DUF4234 domain-containing protein [Candidatus Coliplasma caballi]
MSKISRREIVKSILLSLVTCGIYFFYWKYQLVKNVHILQNDTDRFGSEFACFAFVPFYSLYWWHSRGEVVRVKLGALQ